MTLGEVAKRLELKGLVLPDPGRQVRWGFCSDLLSDALAHAGEGDLWLTHQRHLNVVAVAKLTGVAGVVCVRGLAPSPEVLSRARAEGVAFLLSRQDTFELAGRLFRLLQGEA
ncbi:TPA: serine kinase [Candidatus Acetothermia bacterium]|nr:serine kinase [Candidatus Acetothermia bacterium]